MTTELFSSTQAAIPLAAQIQCVEREIGMRVAVYARRVNDGKMKQATADQEIAAMRAVLATLQGQQHAYAEGFRAARRAASKIVCDETDGDSPFDSTIAHMVDKIDSLVP